MKSMSKKETRQRIVIGLVILLLFVSFAVLYTWPLSVNGGDTILDNPGDSLLQVYIISWTSHAFSNNPLNMFNSTMFYPNRYTLAYSDHQLFISLLAMPLLKASGNPVLAFNFVYILSFVIGALGAYCLVRHLTENRLAGIAGGFIFGFPLFKLAHMAHLNLLMNGLMPFALLCLHLYMERKKPVYAFVFGAFLVGLFWTAWVHGTYMLLTLLIFLIVLGITKRKRLVEILRRGGDPGGRREVFKWGFFLVAALVIAGILVLPFALPYFRLQKEDPVYVRDIREVDFYSADVQDFFVTSENSGLWGVASSGLRENTTTRGNSSERSLFLGLVPLILGALGLIFLWKQKNSRERFFLAFYLTLFITSVVMALGINFYFFGNKVDLFMPYRFLYHLFPGFKAIRTPSRIVVLALLALAVLGGFGVKWIYEKVKSRFNPKMATAVVLVVTLLLAAEMVPHNVNATEFPLEKDFPRTYSWLAEKAGDSPYLVLPLPESDPSNPDGFVKEDYFEIEPVRIYYNTANWKKLFNGYSGYLPASYRRGIDTATGFPDRESVEFFADIGIQYIVIEGERYGNRKTDAIMEKAGETESLQLVKKSGSDLIYRIAPD